MFRVKKVRKYGIKLSTYIDAPNIFWSGIDNQCPVKIRSEILTVFQGIGISYETPSLNLKK